MSMNISACALPLYWSRLHEHLSAKAAWILIIALLSSAAAIGQVTINEIVRIDPSHPHMREGGILTRSGTLPRYYWVVERAGPVKIIPLGVSSMGELPSGEHLELDLRDTIHSYPLLPHLTLRFVENWPPLSGCYDAFNFYHYAGPIDTIYTNLLANVGDTVTFEYQGNVRDTVTEMYYASEVNPDEPDRYLREARMVTLPPFYECMWNKCAQEIGNFRFGIVDTLVQVIRTADTVNVSPHYAGHNTTAETRDTIEFDAQVTYNHQPVANAWIYVPRTIVVDSGGHSSHSANRSKARFQFHQPPNAPSWTTRDSVYAQTDAAGRVHIRFLASEFGGIEKVVATLRSDPSKRDSIHMKTRVAGLILLPGDSSYTQTGGTEKHHGPGASSPAWRTPDDNHWIQDTLLQSFVAAAGGFSGDSKNHSGILRVNDLSLKFGGRFDINGNWTDDEHKSHRIGQDVDIENMNIGILKSHFKKENWGFIKEGVGKYPHFRYGHPGDE
jgi:hypothetical protein